MCVWTDDALVQFLRVSNHSWLLTVVASPKCFAVRLAALHALSKLYPLQVRLDFKNVIVLCQCHVESNTKITCRLNLCVFALVSAPPSGGSKKKNATYIPLAKKWRIPQTSLFFNLWISLFPLSSLFIQQCLFPFRKGPGHYYFLNGIALFRID